MSNIIRLRVDVTKIDKSRIFKGRKGTYLDCTLLPREDDYGNTHMVVQDVSKEERVQGIKGAILGNAKELEPIRESTREQARQVAARDTSHADDMEDDDIPF